MLIAAELLDDVIAHAREEYDAECCGLLALEPVAGAEGQDAPEPRTVRVHRAVNVYASRKRFEIDGHELLKTLSAFEADGLELGAIYHSHTHTAPYPSQTDINFAANWPGLEWLIVGLAEPEPQVRCYLIDGGEVREVELRVQ